jgi:predicted DCC family thiol-disulfide oxidoreductase YuxK
MEHPVILYDGHCALCNGWVRWVLGHDPEGTFHFAPIGSGFAADLLRRCGLEEVVPDTIVVVAGRRAFVLSDGPLEVLAGLPAPWSWLRFGRLVPRWIRDRVYRVVARNRFRWTPRLSVCPPPPAGARGRFHS